MGAGWGRAGTCRRDAQSMGMVNCSDTGPTPRRTPAAPRPSSSVARTRSAASLPPATLRSFHTSFRARSCQSQLCARAPHVFAPHRTPLKVPAPCTGTLSWGGAQLRSMLALDVLAPGRCPFLGVTARDPRGTAPHTSDCLTLVADSAGSGGFVAEHGRRVLRRGPEPRARAPAATRSPARAGAGSTRRRGARRGTCEPAGLGSRSGSQETRCTARGKGTVTSSALAALSAA